MSQEIKKARLRMEEMLEVCTGCLRDWDECECKPVVVGRLMTLEEIKEKRMLIQGHLGGVRG